MKKLLALVMAILMVLCTFASCGGGSASDNTELPDDEKHQTEDNGQSGNIENDKPENGGQTNQGNNGQNTGNGNGSNGGGNGGTSACAHVDNNKNHSCDKCNDKITDCADASKDHKCDICGNNLTNCADNDKWCAFAVLCLCFVGQRTKKWQHEQCQNVIQGHNQA